MFSFIVNSKDDLKLSRLKKSIDCVMHDSPWELIRIQDAKGMCEGYNRGILKSSGDHLIFIHDDIEFVSKDIRPALKYSFENSDVFGVLGTRLALGLNFTRAGLPNVVGLFIEKNSNETYEIMVAGVDGILMHGIQALDGVLIGCHKHVAENLKWDEINFVGWHGYDVDFSYRAHMGGYRVAVCAFLPIYHYTNGSFGDSAFMDFESVFDRKFPQLKQFNHQIIENTGLRYPGYNDFNQITNDLANNFEKIMTDCAKHRYVKLADNLKFS